MSTSITIGATTVHQDEEGRFCLNDLHRAAGAEKRHQPSDFCRLGSTRELIAELVGTPPGIPGGPLLVRNDGRNNGTYASRELVYAYAMWVSAAFHLKVIRAFDALATGRLPSTAFPVPTTFSGALRLAAELQERVEQQQAQLAAQAPKVEAHDRYLDAGGTMSLRDTAKVLGMPEQAFINQLLQDGILYRTAGENGRLRAYAVHEQLGRFVHRAGTAKESRKAYTQVRVTPEGVDWLSRRYSPLFPLGSTGPA